MRTPPSPEQAELLEALQEAHYQSAFRENPSSVAVALAAQGSGNFCQAVAAALMTLGGKHAPIVETYDVLKETLETTGPADGIVGRFLNLGQKVPGWGTSFCKDGIDPLCQPVDAVMAKHFPKIHGAIERVTQALHAVNKMIYPNPSAYTAATALAVGVPRPLAPTLFIHARLPAWGDIFMNSLKGK